MKTLTLTLGAFAMASTSLAAPAFAQDGNGTRQVLGRLLDAVLGPDEKAEEAAEEATETEPAVTEDSAKDKD